jgi:perosamine synthetase
MIPVAKPIIGEEEKKAVLEVLNSGMLAQGSKVKALEEEFAKYCGVKHAIAVNNGTAALHACLYAAGIKQGDEVITVPFTFVATANAIIMQNAKPVFVDIEEDTFNIDPEKVKMAITPKTKAILPVDLYGHIHNHKAIREIADEHGLIVVEDACQAVGAELSGKKAGNFGDLAAFSLYATKNMISGEGGLITTNNDEFAEQCRRFRHHGQSEQTRYQYHDLGYNYRLTDIQAAIALEQLKKIDGFNARRIENARLLTQGLQKIDGLCGLSGLKLPAVLDGVKHVFHQYSVVVGDGFGLSRNGIIEKLKKKGIGSAVFYPKPLHLHPHFSRLGYKEGDFPVSERVSKQIFSLPVHPSLGIDEVNQIINAFEDIKNGL